MIHTCCVREYLRYCFVYKFSKFCFEIKFIIFFVISCLLGNLFNSIILKSKKIRTQWILIQHISFSWPKLKKNCEKYYVILTRKVAFFLKDFTINFTAPFNVNRSRHFITFFIWHLTKTNDKLFPNKKARDTG